MNPIKVVLNIMNRPQDKKFGLAKVYADDLFIIGHPKSGNTWVRFLFGNYITNNQLDFMNKDQVIPAVENDPEHCDALGQPRIIGSHLSLSRFADVHPSFQDKLPRIIFIVRDGRDVAVSYYHHLRKYEKIPYDTPFVEYLGMFNKGMFTPDQPWGRYITAWLGSQGRDDNFLVVKYEDLLGDPERKLMEMVRFAGLELDLRKIKLAVEASSFSNMRNHEAVKYAKPEYRTSSREDLKFVRKGVANQWKEAFSEQMLESFYKVHYDALCSLEYVSKLR